MNDETIENEASEQIGDQQVFINENMVDEINIKEEQLIDLNLNLNPPMRFNVKQCVVRLKRLDDNIIKHYETMKTNNKSERKSKNYSNLILNVNRKLICDLCFFVIESKPRLQRHIETIHKFKRTQCQICQKTYDNKKKWKDHLHMAHKNKKNFKYEYL